MKPSEVKPLSAYPAAVERVSHLHLLQQARGGFPCGEPAVLTVPDKSGDTTTGCWSYQQNRHAIKLADQMTGHLIKAKSGSPTPLVVAKAVCQTYEHERCHALWTSRDFKAVKALLDAEKIPFRLLNLFEDVRIESRSALTMGLPFGEWHKTYGLPTPPEGKVTHPMSPLQFALRWKMAFGFIAGRDHQRHQGTNWASYWPAQTGAALFESSKSPWKDSRRVVPDDCTGSFEDAHTILKNVIKADTTEALLPLLKEWLLLFPLPAGEEDGTSPGETGEPSSTTEGSPVPSGPQQGGDMPKGTFTEATLDSAEATAKALATILASPVNSPERMGDPENLAPAAPPQPASEKPRFSDVEPWPASAEIDNRRAHDVQAWLPYGRSKKSPPDQSAISTLRHAFPGKGGKRFTSNSTGEVSMERYLSRMPEMFTDKKGQGGRKCDVILLIDGSGSMRLPWHDYGYQITTALIALRDSGHLDRLRIVLTGSRRCLMLTHPTLDDATHMQPQGGGDGLWIAYKMIMAERWVEDPENTRVLVLTDGDLSYGCAPDKAGMNAAGIYPVGCYVGDPDNASKLTGDFFDRFLVRETLPDLLDGMVHLLS